ncbi:methyltransferase domain-containing protein [Granulicatella sp. zg-84]|nr:methyltransferase domain-containing protein [Granulicatella sp. zg-84]
MEGKDMIQSFWNKHAQGYSQLIRSDLQSNKVEKWQHFIFDEIDNTVSLNILDIGTGPGFFPAILTSDTRKVTGIDLSDEMIKVAKENLKKLGIDATIIKQDCQETDFQEASFDVLICRNLVWTVPNPEKAYREWYRLLKPNGQLLIFDGSWYSHHFHEDAKKRFDEKAKELQEKYNLIAHNYGDKTTDPEDFDMMNALYLSDKRRPEWDKTCLENIGFTVTKIEENYLDRILDEQEKQYRTDIAPVFFIKAIKK